MSSSSANRQPLIEIVCDGGRGYGYGHLRRSAALARELKSRGVAVRFQSLSSEGSAVQPDVPCDRGASSLVIVDLPYNGDPWVAAAKDLGIPVLTLDSVGTSICPDLDISIWDRQSAPAGTPQKIGLDYAIIRHEILHVHASAHGDGSGVLVIIGGQDVQVVGPLIAARLVRMGQNVTLVEGPLTKEQNLSDDRGYLRLRTPSDLPQRMAACAWAVTNGGGTMMELMFLGKPVWVVPQTDAEAGLAKLVADQRGIMGVGLEGLVLPTLDQRVATSVCASRLVDGKGLSRIADEGLLLV